MSSAWCRQVGDLGVRSRDEEQLRAGQSADLLSSTRRSTRPVLALACSAHVARTRSAVRCRVSRAGMSLFALGWCLVNEHRDRNLHSVHFAFVFSPLATHYIYIVFNYILIPHPEIHSEYTCILPSG